MYVYKICVYLHMTGHNIYVYKCVNACIWKYVCICTLQGILCMHKIVWMHVYGNMFVFAHCRAYYVCIKLCECMYMKYARICTLQGILCMQKNAWMHVYGNMLVFAHCRAYYVCIKMCECMYKKYVCFCTLQDMTMVTCTCGTWAVALQFTTYDSITTPSQPYFLCWWSEMKSCSLQVRWVQVYNHCYVTDCRLDSMCNAFRDMWRCVLLLWLIKCIN